MRTLIGLLLCIMPFAAIAQGYPAVPSSGPAGSGPVPIIYSVRAEGKKDDRQYCYTDLTVTNNGYWRMHTKFSNGKNVDGDHFHAVLVVDNPAGGQSLALRQVAGVRGAAFCSGSCERDVYAEGTIPAGTPMGDWTYLCAGYDEWDDVLIGNAAIKLGSWLVGAPAL